MYQAIVFLPLIGAIFAGFFGLLAGARASEVVTTTLILITALLSWFAFYQVGLEGQEARIELFPFIESGTLKTSWSLRIDTLISAPCSLAVSTPLIKRTCCSPAYSIPAGLIQAASAASRRRTWLSPCSKSFCVSWSGLETVLSPVQEVMMEIFIVPPYAASASSLALTDLFSNTVATATALMRADSAFIAASPNT